MSKCNELELTSSVLRNELDFDIIMDIVMHKITVYKSNAYFLKHLFQASVPFKDNLTFIPITSQCL